MNFRINPLKRSDTVQVVSSWNTYLPYDRITKEKFEDTIFEDPNYEKQGNLVASKNGKLIGFVAAVVREGITGRDGAGRPHEEHFGYIKGLFTLEKHDEKEEVKRNLLEQALNFIKSKGKRIARIGQYTGRYFFPGVDTRWKEQLRFYQENGFEGVDAEEDVIIELRGYQPSEYQKQAQKRIERMGVIIKPYHDKFIEKMRRFVDKIGYPGWFPKECESNFQKKGHYHLVAVQESEIVGWARFFKDPECWWFGPIAVLEDQREKGIGTCLLLESMLKMKALGAPNVTAGWATVPFYTKNGWRVSRRYSVFQRSLE